MVILEYKISICIFIILQFYFIFYFILFLQKYENFFLFKQNESFQHEDNIHSVQGPSHIEIRVPTEETAPAILLQDAIQVVIVNKVKKNLCDNKIIVV